MNVVVQSAANGLIPVPFQGATLYGEAPECGLGLDDLRLLRDAFGEHLDVLLPHMQRHHSHVYIPLSAPDDGYHASFSGRFTLEDLRPFFRQAPNALTVVDGRPWGYLRVRLMAIADDLSFERIAEVEVLSAQETEEAGFELFWAEPEQKPTQIRIYDRRPGEGQQAIGGLVTQWGDKIRKTQILTAAEKTALLAAT